MSHTSHIPSQLLAVLDQGRSLLEGMDAGLYRQIPKPIAPSAIGSHMRHVLDVVQCLVRGAGSEIDYDGRERVEAIEQDPAVALEHWVECMDGIKRLSAEVSGTVRVRSDVPDSVRPEGWMESNVEREMLYTLSHTIHHYALIAMIMRHLGLEPDASFGVAPSTLKHWQEAERCAPLRG